ncbi:MAG: sensor domain-containing diguanylate cyclase [Natronospirillum sp.]|uniref:sensor domain-containing diguanylate cyclase n=1 Tax=Natronospirillum sp. TaxID=2812955 RepID=UPI0025E05B94|nr:sensor domain-containing diguanylate cyclase [Natronospirillum sp.]MCH8551672.1 sensor domain-containing diguanylate cyclase [Natronospirillum sp.]
MNKEQPSSVGYAVDLFPCGCVVTNTERTILSFNEYLCKKFELSRSDLPGSNISTLLTKGSRIFFESYVVPLLTRDGRIEELQMSLHNANGVAVPVIVNARHCSVGNVIYWSLFPATLRDQLFQELVNARRSYQARADEMSTIASTDALTGLLSRGELEPRIEGALFDARASGAPLSLLFIDIDYFKEVNDQFGHVVGDRILEKLGSILRLESRNGDLAFRYGGEEFVIMLTDTPVEEAENVASRLHDRVRSLASDEPSITISIGIASGNSGLSPGCDELLSLADQALYQAKREGRNRTTVFGQ